MKLGRKTVIGLLSLIIISCAHNNNSEWKIADNPILTRWASDVNSEKPWQNYPRPDMIRENWMNLNGLWDYAVIPIDSKPEKWDGKILVPYPLESALSGVKKRITENENLWYKTSFTIPDTWKKQHLLLNFEACDWETKVYIDGKSAGTHRGGYDPFSFDITDLLSSAKKHELLVCVWDPTDKGSQPRGKQVSSPGSIWYTPTTGIWQTVWIEPVNESYISSFRTVTNIDYGTVSVKIAAHAGSASTAKVTIGKDGKIIAEAIGKPGDDITMKIENPQLWSPENPYLYDLGISLLSENKTVDEVKSYTGLRKITIGKSTDGYTRILLNNVFEYQNGPLDQGFWPDGIYTPPTEEAMIYDLEATKKMGFNMLRKHVKVENRIFYYWCDKMGILVWQDMPSGDRSISGSQPDIEKTPESTLQYEYELKRMIETKYNHPSIIMWVPFNEGWGQFETGRITDLISSFDSTRLVNSASGWTDRGTGSVNDIHHYPDPVTPPAEEKRAIVLGEFGGLGLPLEGHTWEKKNWGYKNMTDTLQLLSKYESYYDQVNTFVKKNGLSATIYTQTTDVETETNGLMTYDREIIKMGSSNIFKANKNIIPAQITSSVLIFTDSFTAELTNSRPGGKIYYTTDGSLPNDKSTLFTAPFTVTESCAIKTFTKWEDESSRVAEYLLEKKTPVKAIENIKVSPGLKASIYNANLNSLPDFKTLKPVIVKTAATVNQSIAGKDSLFAIVFEGYISIPKDGVYGLFVNSDDGSRFILDSYDPVLNDGIHGMKEEGRYFPLAKGLHKIVIEYFQRVGGIGLEFLIESPGHKKVIVPASMLFN